MLLTQKTEVELVRSIMTDSSPTQLVTEEGLPVSVPSSLLRMFSPFLRELLSLPPQQISDNLIRSGVSRNKLEWSTPVQIFAPQSDIDRQVGNRKKLSDSGWPTSSCTRAFT